MMFVFRKVLPLEFTHFSAALQGTSCKGRTQLLASHRQVSRVKSCDQKMSGSDSDIRMVGELPIFVDPGSTGATGSNWVELVQPAIHQAPGASLFGTDMMGLHAVPERLYESVRQVERRQLVAWRGISVDIRVCHLSKSIHNYNVI